MATRGLFLLPKGKGVALSRSIVLDFESADKDEFVSYAEDKQKTIDEATLQILYPLCDKSSKVWSNFKQAGY